MTIKLTMINIDKNLWGNVCRSPIYNVVSVQSVGKHERRRAVGR
jgi:hypothetical protein